MTSASMPRFTLRRLLLTVAIMPPLMAAVWYWFDLGKVHAGGEEKAARNKLLAHTPLGSSPDTVLDFVVNKLHRSGQGDAYYKYLRAYEASTGKTDNQLTPADLITAPRTISVVVSSRPANFFMAHEVRATWHFDERDKLVDIKTMEYGIGPYPFFGDFLASAIDSRCWVAGLLLGGRPTIGADITAVAVVVHLAPKG